MKTRPKYKDEDSDDSYCPKTTGDTVDFEDRTKSGYLGAKEKMLFKFDTMHKLTMKYNPRKDKGKQRGRMYATR